eukprot:12552459-Ditylum_brightwellii.AAC.1
MAKEVHALQDMDCFEIANKMEEGKHGLLQSKESAHACCTFWHIVLSWMSSVAILAVHMSIPTPQRRHSMALPPHVHSSTTTSQTPFTQ